MPQILRGLPPELNVTELFDQSLFVRAAIKGVLREGAIAAVLTGLMILLFLGSWRSTLIVCISIPLSILTSIIILSRCGETINVMTLGGLALAVGILVDDATVEIENVHRNMAMRKPITRAILDGAQQIAVPAFVSTLAICIVFVPVLLLTGAANICLLRSPMAVVFAMMTSYFLSRTLVPTMVHYLLRPEVELYQQRWRARAGRRRRSGACMAPSIISSKRMRDALSRRAGLELWTIAAGDRRVCDLLPRVAGLVWWSGEDFFPYVDSGQMRLHVRARKARASKRPSASSREWKTRSAAMIPREEIDTILDNIGLPPGGINLAFSDSATIGNGDGEILVSLNQEKHGSTLAYERKLRAALPRSIPGRDVFFQAANITNQILNFGLPAPIDVQVVGRDTAKNYKIAQAD